MSEVLLEALMQLYALLTVVKQTDTKEGRAKVEEYLSEQFSTEYVKQFLKRYDYYLGFFNAPEENAPEDEATSNLVVMSRICADINREIDLEAKILILNSLLNFMREPEITEEEELFIDNLAEHLRIPPSDYWNLKDFSLGEPLNVADKGCLLLINGNPDKPNPDIKHIFISKQQVSVWVLHIKRTNTFLFRCSNERNLYLSGHKVEPGKVYPMEPGAVINTSHVRPVYYGHIAEKFITKTETGRIIYKATDIEYKFSDNNIGIHRFSYLGKSGQLVGIMGGSGSGKSTLMNVMNGNLKLSNGSISINGYDLHRDHKKLQGVIGYVPQDDMLNEELTVYENLLFNARLVFSNCSKKRQHELVEKAINDFDLVEAQDLRVGTPLNKVLSGGQRKRLNIALELMREPSILFVDEPTSGLSSFDSEKVMMLLKRQALKGKLVIINIHQPNSDIYKLLDKLVIIDQGGHVVYNGNPMHAIVYFKRKAHYVNPEERECYVCGNVKTEQPLRIIEARMVDPSGKLIRKRKVSPEEWYRQYCDEFEASFEWKYKERVLKEKLPPNLYSVPSRISQFRTYVRRDALKKLKDTQSLLINIFEVPILAFLLAFCTRYLNNAGIYDLYTNENIPTYLFMSVIVAIFVGLNVSAQEIIKDRKLLVREKFLNLSRSAYLNSKILNLFVLAALQSLALVLIGDFILGLADMWLGHWVILFSTFATSIVFGLNISSGLKSTVSIYILIPLIIVPQLLFSGTMVRFDHLHQSITNKEYVPRIGDLMISRWSYEALAVYQFTENEYERRFFNAEQKRSEASYAISTWIPELKKINKDCETLRAESKHEELKERSELLFTEISKLSSSRLKKYPKLLRTLMSPEYDETSFVFIEQQLEELKARYSEQFDTYNAQIDSINLALVKQLGSTDAVVALKHRNTNEAIDEFVLNKRDFTQVEVYSDVLVRKKQPIYNITENHWGRAHFYAPYKRFADFVIPTQWFNCIVLWIFTIVLYFTLYFDLLRRLLRYIEKMQMHRMHRRLQKLRV